MKDRFTEKDVIDIIKEASLLQSSAEKTDDTQLNIVDIKQIALESGVDPVFVEQALLNRLVKSSSKQEKHVYTATLVGEIAPDRMDIVQDSLAPLKPAKQFTQLGRSVEGIAKAGWTNLHVEATSRRGKTKISVRPYFAQTFVSTGYVPAVLAFLSAFVGVMRSHALLGLALAVPLVLLSWFLTSWGLKKASALAEETLARVSRGVKEELHAVPLEHHQAVEEPVQTRLSERS